jgi:3-oxoacyl-[acyl-carrier protein] reductase
MLTALVTGGARGIGLAYVEALLARNYRVALLDLEGAVERAAELNAASAAAAESAQPRVLGLRCDVGDAAAYRAAFDAACAFLLDPSDANACLSVVVLNAGIMGCLFQNARRIVEVNLLGSIQGAEMAIKHATHALQRPASQPMLIAITSSTNGLVPADSDFSPIYVSTKFGINGFVHSMAPIGRRLNFRINAIAPVTVMTPMVRA